MTLRVEGARRAIVRTAAAVFLLAGAITLCYWPQRSLVLHGRNDFPQWYIAGSLAGTPDLYRKAAFLSRELSTVGAFNEHIQFIRFPYYALVFRPLSWLPYQYAWWVWLAGCVAALVAFAWLWPDGRRFLPILAILPPVVASFGNGQDIPFLLLWVALAVYARMKGRGFVAGLLLSLCLAKFHLFLFVPVALIARREWKMLQGGAVGALALLTLSFAVAGLTWPVELAAVWRDPAIHPDIDRSSLFAAATHSIADVQLRQALWLGLLLAVAGVMWYVSRRVSLVTALGAAMTFGVVSAFHVYLQDYSLCIPLLLVWLSNRGWKRHPERLPVPDSGV